MFPLGHIGISVGIVYLLAVYVSYEKKKDKHNRNSIWDIDFRIVIIAAMIPDIVDKLVGMLFFKNQFSNGRIFTHSMLIIGIISICLFALGRYKLWSYLKTSGYALAVWMHLVLDFMWEKPKTLFWPFLGVDFPKIDVEFTDYFVILFSEPIVFIGEFIGAMILLTLILSHGLYTKPNILKFFQNGRLNMNR